jgi:uncharacterized protein
MHVDVSDILRQGEGAQTEFLVEGETPQLDDLSLTEPVSGSLQAIGTEDGVMIVGRLSTAVNLECHRCLRTFAHSLEFPFQAEFADSPGEDQYSIDKYGKVDLTEPLRQEIMVHLPLQQLCQADCNGIILKQTKDDNGSS